MWNTKKIRISVQPKDRVFVKGYGFLSFAKNMDKNIEIYIYIYYQSFPSRTLTTHRVAGERRGPSFIPLYHFHPLTIIQTFILQLCTEMTITYFKSHCLCLPGCYSMRFTILSHFYLTDWWCDVDFRFFNLLFDSRFLLQLFDTGNRWTQTLIDNHPYITSEPTN